MFSKKKNNVNLSQQVICTLISEGCIFEGNLTAPANVRVDGQIIGDVTIDEGLILGEKGVIRGSVITKELIVYGTIQGHVNTHSLEIRGTGRITGDIKTQVLQVEPGGSHNGRLSMSPSHDNTAIRSMKIENASATRDGTLDNPTLRNGKSGNGIGNKTVKPEADTGNSSKEENPENNIVNN